MQIYKDYTTLNLLFNEPCNIDDKCTVYPISVKDYEKFMGYTKYLSLSKKQLMLGDKDNLLQTVILISVAEKTQGQLDLTNPKTIDSMNDVLEDFCRMFSIITKKKIECKSSNNGGFYFVGEKTLIDSNNYDDIREAIMKMTLLKEPKVFKDKLAQKWYNKALIAKQKSRPKIELEDIIIIVSQDLKMSLKDMINMNVFQLYSYYYRIINRDNYDKLMNFKLVTDKVPNTSFSNSVIEMLYKDDDSDMYLDGNTLNKMI